METDAEVFLRSGKVLPAGNGGDLPSFGTEEPLLSHAKGPVIFRECVGAAGTEFVDVFDEAAPQGTLGSEAEKLVNREGSEGCLAGADSVISLACPVDTLNGLATGVFADSSCPSVNLTLSIDAVDARWVVRRGDLLGFSGEGLFVSSTS